MNIISKGMFGSHLYKLNTESSDVDIKGVYLPSVRDIILNTSENVIDLSTNKSNIKNTSKDTDEEYYRLDYFIRKACVGETFAIDMLHMDSEVNSHIWDYLVANRTKFYSKSMKSLVGYARKQAAKYSVKGSRLAFINAMCEKFNQCDNGNRLEDYRDDLIVGEFSSIKIDASGEYYEACGKKFYLTTPMLSVKMSFNKMSAGYGSRAKLAADNKGVDWKAVSHALRACYQQRDILIYGDFNYPLKESEYLMKVKLGELDFIGDVQIELESVLDEVMDLSEKSELPEKCDIDFWNDFIYNVYIGQILGEYK